MVQALEGKLQDVDRINGQTVSRIARGASGIELHLDSGRVLAADAAVLAVPAFAAAELLADLPAAGLLREIRYVSVANVVLAFHEEDIPRQLGGTGFLVPRKEKRQITACTWTSSKWMHTAPKGKALLRCYVGRSGDESWTELTDEELIRSVRSELQHLMGIEQQPLFYEVTRWHRAMPQYRVGHLTRLERVKEELAARMPGVFLAGSAYYGVGIPDCIRQGKEAAEQVFRHVADRIAARG
jgi:oxygen-dependent protoporphyrinogen oxidase